MWNTSALVEELRAKRLSEREKAKYLAATWVVFSLLPYMYLEVPTSRLLAVEAVLTILVTIIGIAACYRANARGDGEEFVGRFVCLSLPIGLRVLVAGLALYFAYTIVGYAVLGEERFDAVLSRYTIIDLVFTVAVGVAFYARLRSHILRVSAIAS